MRCHCCKIPTSRKALHKFTYILGCDIPKHYCKECYLEMQIDEVFDIIEVMHLVRYNKHRIKKIRLQH